VGPVDVPEDYVLVLLGFGQRVAFRG